MRSYSKGMIQRAGLAQALIGGPELLILDEPMTGLDPIGRRDMRELILSLKEEGKTVFYSTHIIPDIEVTCDGVTIVDGGITRTSGPLPQLLAQSTTEVVVSVRGLDRASLPALAHRVRFIADHTDTVTFAVTKADAASELVSDLVTTQGVQVLRFEPHRRNLETAFIELLGQGGAEKEGS